MKVIYSASYSIIVTGYKGYIARELIKKVGASDWKETNLDFITEPCTIIHLAAKADIKDGSVNLLRNNTIADLCVIDSCVKYGHRLVYASTNNVYPLKVNCRQGENHIPNDSYSLSKFVGEKLLKLLPASQYIILRLADVFGYGQKYGNFFKALEHAISKGQQFNLTDRGDKLRSYIYIDELVDILIYSCLIDKYDGGIYNICHKEPLSLFDISLALLGDVLANNESSYDYRTMEQSCFFDYKYQFTMKEALARYLFEIKNRED